MTDPAVIDWLLEGDVAIQYQVHRDLLGAVRPDLQRRIAREGWGQAFLARRNPDGHWGRRFYQPKWISTHYTLLDLRNLDIAPDVPEIRETIGRVLRENRSPDGGINPAVTIPASDVCVTGMALNYAAYFRANETALHPLIDFLLHEHLADGGFNCWSNHQGCTHSSLHTTLSVLEGIEEYRRHGYEYRLDELLAAAGAAREFILMHRLFKSDKTGAVIDPKMTLLAFPCRWKYDILRALDYFQYAGSPYDPRMDDALALLQQKRRADGRWPLQGRHAGAVHFDMETPGQPSRWNTLRALRVLRRLRQD